jgi:hypothetical protein
MTDLVDLMERATASMPVDTTRLVNGGLQRGAAEVRRRRGRATGWIVGVAAATLLAGAVVPRLFSGSDTAREPATSMGATALQLLPTDELLQRFAEQLPGTSTPMTMHSSDVPESVMIQRELTNADGMTGLAQVDVSVSEPYGPDGIAENKAFCREMQVKVGPRDGTDCVIVPGGVVQFWDDTVPPEDPGDDAPGIRLAYAYFMRWDGGNVNLRAFNSTSTDIRPAPGAVPVIRTADVVDLVQRLDVFTQR